MSDGGKSDETAQTSPPVSRRKMLVALSAGAVGGIAGCSDEPGEQNDPSPGGGTTEGDDSTAADQSGDATGTAEGTTGGSGQYGYDESSGRVVNPPSDPVTTSITTAIPGSWTPSTYAGNPFSTDPLHFPNLLAFPISWGLWDEVVVQMTTGEPANIMAKNIKNEGPCSQVIEFHEGSEWWDGTPVTVRDMKTTQEITDFFWGDPATYEVIDDYTLRRRFKTPTDDLLRVPVNYPLKFQADHWEDELQKLKDAEEEGEDALASAKEEFASIQFTIDRKVEEGLGSGLWKPVEWSDTEVVHEINEGHYRSDWTNLEEWRVQLVSDNAQTRQLRQNDKVDLFGGKAAQVPENTDLERVRDFYNNASRGLTFNYRKPHVGRREVRQAIAFLIDFEKLGKALQRTTGTQVNPPLFQSGLARPVDTNWLGEDWMNRNLVDYGRTAKPEKATQRLEAAGYSKDGDTWVGPDGKEMNDLAFVGKNNQVQKIASQSVVSALNQFGIGAETLLLEDSTYTQRVETDHDFSMASTAPGASNGLRFIDPHARWKPAEVSTEFMATWNEEQIPDGCEKAEMSSLERLRDTWPLNDAPVNGEYPSEPKSLDPGSSTEQIDPITWYYTAAQEEERDYIVEKDRQFARWINYSVPSLQFFDENWSHVLDTRNFMNADVPKESRIMFSANQLRGLIAARSE